MASSSSSGTPASRQIYEGTNGIQAMDLVGRKLPKDGGRGVRAFFEMVGRDIAEAKAAGDPAGVAAALEPAVQDLQAATMWLAQNGMADPDNAGAGAYAYMDLMGLVSLGWMWIKMAAASQRAMDEGTSDEPFHDAKLVTARFYAQRELADVDRAAQEDRGRRRNADERFRRKSFSASGRYSASRASPERGPED